MSQLILYQMLIRSFPLLIYSGETPHWMSYQKVGQKEINLECYLVDFSHRDGYKSLSVYYGIRGVEKCENKDFK